MLGYGFALGPGCPVGRAQETLVFAIIQNGGHQVKVVPGAVVTVDHFDAAPGDEVAIDQVLVVGRDSGEVTAGAPFVAGARVLGRVVGDVRGPKIRVFKKKRRKGYRRTRGHRSTYTRVEIRDIVVG
jgi:large subunit ribosomal protein L21